VIYSGPLASSLQGSTGPAAIMSAWSGATFDANDDALIVWGGGHNDYYGNEVYAFSLKTLQWSELDLPSAMSPGGTVDTNSDNTPVSTHTYDSLAFIPELNSMFVPGEWGASQVSTNQSWLFNPASANPNATGAGIWKQATPVPSDFNNALMVDLIANYDPTTHNVFVINYANGLHSYNPSTNSWTAIGSGAALSDYHMTGAIDPVDNILVATGGGFLNAVNLTTGAVISPPASGDLTVQNGNAPGFVWDPAANEFVGWNGGSTLYTLDPHTWLWTAHPAAAINTVTPTAPTADGTFGRFQYDAADNVFIVVNDVNQGVYVYKPDFGSATGIGVGGGSGSTLGGGTTGAASGTGSTTGSGTGGTAGTGTTGTGSTGTTGTGSSGGTSPGTGYGSGTGATPGSGSGGATNSSGDDPYLHHLMPAADVLLQALLNSGAHEGGHSAAPGHPVFFAAGEAVHTTVAHGDWMFHF
jgi:hypothetical protein